MDSLPEVTILMAIYNPNVKWLEEQLRSLNAQTYSNLKLLVWNDSPDDLTDYEAIYKEHITNFPFKIFVGKKNLGSNGAFEELTKLASSEYVAYCDQDDIWLPEKVDVLVKKAVETDADLLCSDMYVIDSDGNVVANSITKVRPRHIFYEGDNLFEYLLSRNFVTGCTTLVKTSLAMKSLPFPKVFVHDWWLAIFASVYGKIFIINKPLIQYRIHGNNQTGVFTGINTKYDYYVKRIKNLEEQGIVIIERYRDSGKDSDINNFIRFVNARKKYFENTNIKNFFTLYKLRFINRKTTYFELLLPYIPCFLFVFIVAQLRKGRI